MHRFHIFFRALLLAAMAAANSCAQSQSPYYDEIEPAQATRSEGRIEVLEAFLYTCPHCYALEPHMQRWLANKPADVEFKRMIPPFSQSAVNHARAYLAVQKMGVLESVHEALFQALHRDGKRVLSEDELRRFYAGLGVDGDRFIRIYDSNEVTIEMRHILELARSYGITQVPTVIINGKYRTTPAQAGSYENFFRVIDQLIGQERAAMKAGG